METESYLYMLPRLTSFARLASDITGSCRANNSPPHTIEILRCYALRGVANSKLSPAVMLESRTKFLS